MSRYSTLARIIIAVFTMAVFAALSAQQPARATAPNTSANTAPQARPQAQADVFDDLLMAYATVLIRNGQAGSVAQARLAKQTAAQERPGSRAPLARLQPVKLATASAPVRSVHPRIERAGRLVQVEDVGLVQQSTRDFRALEHPAR
jgi:hypothetical protein